MSALNTTAGDLHYCQLQALFNQFSPDASKHPVKTFDTETLPNLLPVISILAVFAQVVLAGAGDRTAHFSGAGVCYFRLIISIADS
ncbi:hypothetical protein [Serratia proteamaculans]|uniref:hypothetical protein n=1 Tax=Serratia proteamaculans TaxID=28151 RepID=UPI003CF2359D